jgi:hypothetical protein
MEPVVITAGQGALVLMGSGEVASRYDFHVAHE